jgi:hypothetical protein
VAIITLMVFVHEAAKLELLDIIRRYIPKEEGANRIAPHQRVKQFFNLLGIPDKLALDGR